MNEDRYEIREKIGQGGAGAVYRAYDRNLNREVAIKRVLADEGFDANDSEDCATKALLKEAIALCSVQHPHIVTVYDAGVDEDGPYVVMELLPGKTIDEVCPVSWDDFKELANQSLEALIAAQELNLVHRDIKPTNVMVNSLPSGRFQVKLVDFGLAKFSAAPSLQTIDHSDSVFGSIHFMAPEQFERVPLDKRTDMYSLGCVYYFALTGEYPFDGETAPQVMASHLANTFTPLSELRPDIPEWICQWVEWHMARGLTDRPSGAKESLERLQEFEEFERQSTGPVEVTTAVSQEEEVAAADFEPTTNDLEMGVETSRLSLQTGPVFNLGAPNVQRRPSLYCQASSSTDTASHIGVKPSLSGSSSQSFSTKKSANKTPLIALAALIGIGILVLSIAFAGKSGDTEQDARVQAMLLKASAPTETLLAIKGPEIDALLAHLTDAKANDKKAIYRALLLANAIDDTDVDQSIAKFATQENGVGERERIQLFQILERRDQASPLSILSEFIGRSKSDEAVVAAIKAIQNHISDDQVSGLLKLISKTSSNRVREVAEQSVALYLDKKFEGLGNNESELSQASIDRDDHSKLASQ